MTKILFARTLLPDIADAANINLITKILNKHIMRDE